MPNCNKHCILAIKEFGRKHEELIIMINSWMDSPVRKLGKSHRRFRHDFQSVMDACVIYGDNEKNIVSPTPKNILLCKIILHHLKLDGLVSPRECTKLEKKFKSDNWINKNPPPLLLDSVIAIVVI